MSPTSPFWKAEAPDSRCAVYVHLPFCASRCGYCDFATTETVRIPFESYTDALGVEWERTVAMIDARIGGSIYFGGGTPSLWPATNLSAILRRLVEPLAVFEEVTVEVNPRDADEHWFCTIAEAGFNRVSVGVQAMDDRRLKWMGRTHNVAQARQTVELARNAGIDNISVDFIYGTPEHTLAGIEEELLTLIELEPAHVSAYELTISSRCTIGRGEMKWNLPDDDARADMWWQVNNVMTNAGFRGYEVSNYALPGRESMHNRHYWQGGCYVGLGAGAHGHLCIGNRRIRYGNSPDVPGYIALSKESIGPGVMATLDPISDMDLARELLMLGLRTSDGVNLNRIAAFAPDEYPQWHRVFERWQAAGFVQISGDRLIPEPSGMLMADALSENCF